MKDLFVLYYGLEEREIVGEQLFYKSTLPNLAITFLFENQDVNSTAQKVVKGCYKESFDKIYFNIQKFASLSISDFEITPQFSLNLATLNHFKVQDKLCPTS